MPGAQYTAYAVAKSGPSFGPSDRFIKAYGLPSGRDWISQNSLENSCYDKIEKLTGGALNEGIWKTRKRKGTGRNAGRLCVMKKIGLRGLFLREIEVLWALEHPNIVEFVQAHIPSRALKGEAELFVEYCDRGSLQRVLNNFIRYNKDYDWPRRPYEHVPEAFIWHVFRSIASALAYLHWGTRYDDLENPPRAEKNWPYILHRDLKPDNILLKSTPPRGYNNRHLRSIPHPEYPTVVLADFGLCTQEHENKYNINEDIENHNQVGTFGWQPPELSDHNSRGEVWTLGAMMMALCWQRRHGPVPEEYYEKVEGRLFIRDLKYPEYYSKKLRETIRDTLRFDRYDRPFSNILLGRIREAEAKIKPKYEPLLGWAFRTKEDWPNIPRIQNGRDA